MFDIFTKGLKIYRSMISAHTVFVCASCDSEYKQRLFPQRTLNDFFAVDTE